MNLPEVLIHLSEDLNKAEKDELVENLRSLDGVIAPRFSLEKEHLLFVSYNSDMLDSASLLEKVRDSGFNAQLVGL